MSKKIVIALSSGDAAGIGPELAVKIAQLAENEPEVELRLYGSPEILEHAGSLFAPNVKLNICPVGNLKWGDFTAGVAQEICGIDAYESIRAATLDALKGEVDALVTAPVNKYAVNLAGIEFTGHTEMIAELCNCDSFAMMQSSGRLHVAFVTTHIALKDVAQAVTVERIVEVGRLLDEVLREEGVTAPLIGVAGLNPHAGENGCMGEEDELVVKPALVKLREAGIRCEGPFPSDTLFVAAQREKFDGILSMYHDQGHIPFKMLAFDTGVNSTLNLPIIRTSPDHGTAYDLAWQGRADAGSITAAFKSALLRAKHRKNLL